MKITGTHINYYFHCKRHLWLFVNHLQMEHTNELVELGRFISDTTYKKEKHEIHLEDDYHDIIIDYYDKIDNVVYEIKKSNKMEITHIWQVKFYIYVLEKNGIKNVKGIINYPKLKKRIEVELSNEERNKIEEIKNEIEDIINQKNPPPIIKKPYCKSCAYYELCYV